LVVWNRSLDKARPLEQIGARLASNPREAAAGCDIAMTMLADDAALQQVLSGEHGLLSGLRPAAMHISMSTIAVSTADQIAAEHAARQQKFISAPVFGRPEAAAAAKLFVVAAGSAPDIDRAEPVFACISQRVFRLGATPSAANLVKLCGNFMILSAIEALGEAMALAEKGGVERRQLLEVITGTVFDAPIYRIYGDILAQRRFRPAGFAAPLGLKDMRLAAEAAEALRVPMPLLGVLRNHLLQTIAREGEDIDWSGIAGAIAANAGSKA
jgi:3-hydroxyisobutyrate dehydrogenase-like beta-hydroxyacid dehydrogenase